MEVSRIENLPPPPGIINSIKAGFDAIASHVTAILMPLLLNLLLWLGPRLQMDTLFKSIEGDMVRFWQASQIPADEIQNMLEMYDQMTKSVNLFGVVRTLPIGISSLFLPSDGVLATPLGQPGIWQVTGVTFPLSLILLTLVGWIGGAFYFRSVAGASLAEKITSVSTFQAALQTVLISIASNMFLFALTMPILLIIFVAMQLSVVLANLVVLLIALGSVWVIVPIFLGARCFSQPPERVDLGVEQHPVDAFYTPNEQPLRYDGFPALVRIELSVASAFAGFVDDFAGYFRSLFCDYGFIVG
ncbi:MAG: hypothetical protein IPJ47_13345 [Anaerolineales bacterium]|nr:hypothetical protein [Anaerolineales bacterium]